MRRQRKTKILATLGPASSSAAMLKVMFESGVDCFRFNMSHITHDQVRTWHKDIRALEASENRPIGILVDLQGPKLRIGEFSAGEVYLEEGRTFVLDERDAPGDSNRVTLPHNNVVSLLQPGGLILIDDGRIELEVTEVDRHFVKSIVRRSGTISNHKGVNFPGIEVPFSSITEKDQADLDLCLDLGVDWFALSFVKSVADVELARALIGDKAGLIAKIERPSALNEVEAIIEAADGVMVARGDLGVEMPLELLPGIQKDIIKAARLSGKPVIVATQMLESMIENQMPTRAEISDVATAVFDGADAVMLSAESAIGAFPKRAVSMMNRVAEQVERELRFKAGMDAQLEAPERTGPDAISAAAHQVAETLGVAAIVSYTTSGSTGLRAARERPNVPILALTPKIETARRLSLVWGIHCVHTEDAHDFADMVHRACHLAFREGFAEVGQQIVVTAGVPFGTPGATNVLRIADVGKEHEVP